MWFASTNRDFTINLGNIDQQTVKYVISTTSESQVGIIMIIIIIIITIIMIKINIIVASKKQFGLVKMTHIPLLVCCIEGPPSNLLRHKPRMCASQLLRWLRTYRIYTIRKDIAIRETTKPHPGSHSTISMKHHMIYCSTQAQSSHRSRTWNAGSRPWYPDKHRIAGIYRW